MPNQINIPNTTFTLNDGDTIMLTGFNGQYVRVIEYNSNEWSLDLSSIAPDQWKRFRVTIADDLTILLQSEGNWKYLSNINRLKDGNPIEADKTNFTDPNCNFSLSALWGTGNTLSLIFLANGNGNYWSVIQRNGAYKIEADHNYINSEYSFFGVEINP